MHFRPIDGGMFLPFPKLLRAGLLRRLDPEIIHAELMVQLAAFKELFGRAPDFVDGHQHAQLFPQVRDAFLRGGERSRARTPGSARADAISRWHNGSARPRRWCSIS